MTWHIDLRKQTLLGFVSAIGGLIRQRVGHYGGLFGGIQGEANGHASPGSANNNSAGIFQKDEKEGRLQEITSHYKVEKTRQKNDESRDRLQSLTVELEGSHDGK